MKVKNDYLKLDIQRFADGEITYKVSLDGNEAERTISNLSKSSDTLSKKFTSFGTKMSIGVTAPLTALATAGVKYNATMESYLANLTTLLGGNQQEAQKLLDTLKEMANTTPYEATDLVKATQKMMAFGISAEDSLKYLNMLGDIAMGDANKMDSLTLAFSQISASGRATMEDINQMIDQGFNPLTIIAQKTGENMGDLRDRVSAGGVSFQEIADAMRTATSEGGIYFGSMDKASQTTDGKISTLKDDFNSALGSMTESLLPFAMSGVEKLSQLAQWFSNLDDNGKKVVLTIAGIAMAIGPLSLAIGTLIKVGTGISTVVSIIKSWNLATKAMTAAQWLLNAAMSANPITLMVLGIAALIAILVVCYNKFEWFRDGVNAIAQGIANFFINAWNLIYNTASSVWNGVLGLFSQGGRIFLGITEGIANFFKTVVNALLSGINKVIATPFNLINGTLNKIRNIEFLGISPFKGLWGQNPIRAPQIPMLNVGTNYVGKEGLAYLHEGEAVVPKKYNPAIGGYGNNFQPNITIIADMDVNKFGKAFVRDIKTFSGGAKNAYNYGGGK